MEQKLKSASQGNKSQGNMNKKHVKGLQLLWLFNDDLIM